MKKREHLFEAIGQVDDRLVEEAADARRTATPWKKWAALAACLVLVIGLSASSLALLFRGCGSAMTSDSAASETASDTAEAPAADGSTGTAESGSAETTDDSVTEDSATADSSVNAGTDPSTAEENLPVIGTLSADAGGLTASRAVTLTAEGGALVIRDVYRLTAAGDVDTVLHYAMTAEDAGYTVTVDGREQAVSSDAAGLTFPLRLTAGAEAEVAVTVTLPVPEDGVVGAALATDGGSVALTDQTAELALNDPNVSVLESTFNVADGPLTLTPPETYRLVLQMQ